MKKNESDFHQAINITIDSLKKYQFMLNEDFFINIGIKGFAFDTQHFQITEGGLLIIHEGYAWDGASGAIDNAEFLLTSMVHDVLYQAIRLQLLPPKYRKQADHLLATIGRANGMSWTRSRYSYLAVRAIGWMHIKPTKSKLKG